MLRSGPFRRLLTAQFVSALGDWVATFAFMAAAFEETESALGVAVILVLRLVPPIFAAPLGGVLADRFDRRTIMITADLVRAGIIVMAPFVGIVLLYVIALAHEMVTLFFIPARDAAVPALAPRDELPAANGMVLGSSFGALPIGGTVFAGLQAVSGNLPAVIPFADLLARNRTALAFMFDAVTFLVSAAILTRLRIPQERRDGELKPLKGVAEGLRFVAARAPLRSLGYGLIVSMFGGGVLFAIGVPYVRRTLDASDTMFGLLGALWGVGMAVGLAVARIPVGERKAWIFLGGVVLSGVVLVAMGLVPVLALALMLAVVFGTGFSAAVMLAMAVAQKSADERIRGRIMGGIQMLFRAGLGAGALGMGALAQAVGEVDVGPLTLDGNQVGMVAGGAVILLGAAAAVGVTRSPHWGEV